MTIVHLDKETRGVADLTKVGLYRYAEHPDTGVILFRYRFDKGPYKGWRMGTPVPADLVEHIRQGRRVVAHNSVFERRMWNDVLRRTYPELPELTIEQMDCTMSRAAAVGIPQSLENCARALDALTQKDLEGRALMLKMCKPAGFTPEGLPVWKQDEASMARLGAYCEVDVATEFDVDAILPHLSARERRVWELDQRINDRGFPVDVKSVGKALRVVEEAKKTADTRMWELTEGAITKTSQAARLVKWVASRGIPCESVADGEIEDLVTAAFMMDDEAASAALRLRQASAVTFKFEALLNQVCADGRVRGSLNYHGTLSKRWSGRGVQPHNFKRLDNEKDVETARMVVELLQNETMSPADTAQAIEMLCDCTALEALSLCARSMIAAKANKKLIGGDYTNIEGRMCAWLAGEHWKLDAFRAYDAGTGPDLYRVMASLALGKPIEEVTPEDRQLWGKVPELACQFQGDVPAFNKMGAKYGVRLPESQSRFIVDTWRDTNQRIKAMWRELQDAAIDAVANPGLKVPCCGGKVQYLMSNGFLWCRLPSESVIAYPKPTLRKRHKIVVIDGEEIEFNNWGITFWGERKGYREIDLYGGMQCAHVVSGSSRDILVDGMFALEEAGYPLCLTIHDEDLSEVDTDFGSVEDYQQKMLVKNKWHEGLPLSAKAWEDFRYVK